MANTQPYLQRQLDELISNAKPDHRKWSSYRMAIARYLRNAKEFSRSFGKTKRSNVIALAHAQAKRDFRSTKLGVRLRFDAYQFLQWSDGKK